MKKRTILSFVFFLLLCNCVSAQNLGALTIFSENGEKFYLILNGQRQNNIAQTNVRVDGLTQPNYTAKIIFEDKALPEISRNFLAVAGENHEMMDVTYKIKHDKNGLPKLSMMPTSFIPYQQTATPAPDVYVVHYGNTEPAPATTTISQTTNTTTAVVPANAVNVNVNGINMGVTINDPNATAVQTTTTRTTTTTTEVEKASPAPAQTNAAPRGCNGSYNMMPGDFQSAVNTLKGQSFDETKLSTAKQIAGKNCLSSGQITEICKLFGFEDNKLAFAKFAYDRCTDPQNYFKVSSVFSFSSNADDLNQYIQNK